MEHQIAELRERIRKVDGRVDGIEAVLRGSGRDTGLISSVVVLSDAVERQGVELVKLAGVPRSIEELRLSSEKRGEAITGIEKQLRELVQASKIEKAKTEAEVAAIARLAMWLKVGAGLIALLVAIGGTATVALVDRLGAVARLAGAIQGIP
jgi:hypothetical protein